jgi:proteasome inhibitor subunit 1 (PI31)
MRCLFSDGAGGMIMGRKHRGWSSMGNEPNRDVLGAGVGPTILPPGAVPPGARFDPIVPGRPPRGPHQLPSGAPSRQFS